jgi:hypothetical protein
MLWEVFFMLVILKIPVVYMCAVVWWAIRAEPEPPAPPLDGVPVAAPAAPAGPRCDWRARVAARRDRPSPRPRRAPARPVRLGT